MTMKEGSRRLSLAIAKRPWFVIAAFAAALTGALAAASTLRLQTDIEEMLPPGNPHAEAFKDLTKAFSTTSTLIVAVTGPDRETLIAAAEDFRARMISSPETKGLVRNVRLGMDRAFAETWGLALSEASDLEDRESMLARTNLVPFLRSLNDTIETSLSDGSAEVENGDEERELISLMTGFELFATDLRAAIEDGATDGRAAERLVDDALLGERYMIDPEGRTLLLVVAPTFDLGERGKLTALADGARRVGEAVTLAHADARFAFAGDVAVEADEERSLGADSFYPSLAAIAIIFALFFFSYRSMRAILLSLVTLVAGILLDLGIAALAVGRLNMITSSFGVLLVGLGIDFCVHLSLRFDEARVSGMGAVEAIAESVGKVFVPVSVGALTTAAAFYSLLVSESEAFREFGLIAGSGILCCLVSAFALLPALLAAFPGKSAPRPAASAVDRPMLTFATLARVGTASARGRAWVVAAAVAVAAASALAMRMNAFDHDFRAIGPTKTASRAAEDLIGERFRISTYTGLAVAGSPDEAEAMAERARKAPFVRSVESIADYVAPDAEQDRRLAIIRRMRDAPPRYADRPWDLAAARAFADEIRRLEWNVVELVDLATASLGEDTTALRKRDHMIREIRGAEAGAPGAEVFSSLARAALSAAENRAGLERLSALDSAFARAMDARVRTMSRVDRRIAPADLPEDMRRELVSDDGTRYLVSVRPSHALTGDDNVLRYARGLSAADARFTGTLQLGYELSRVTLEEAKKSAAIVAAVILALTFAGFMSAKYALACFASLGVAVAALFGIYPFVAKFNIVSILALPLIFGMGIDYAVHLAASHQSLGGLRGLDRLRASLADAGKPIALSALTTLIGFGSLALIASYKGIRDLGVILSLGIALCLAATFTVLPAILALGSRARSAAREEERRASDEEAKEVS